MRRPSGRTGLYTSGRVLFLATLAERLVRLAVELLVRQPGAPDVDLVARRTFEGTSNPTAAWNVTSSS